MIAKVTVAEDAAAANMLAEALRELSDDGAQRCLIDAGVPGGGARPSATARSSAGLASTVYVVGGPAAIPDAWLTDHFGLSSPDYTRIAGSDRWRTQERVAAAIVTLAIGDDPIGYTGELGTPGLRPNGSCAGIAVLTNLAVTEDRAAANMLTEALQVISGDRNARCLIDLGDPATQRPPTIAAVESAGRAEDVYVVGGVAAVPDVWLTDRFNVGSFERIAGSDRWETQASVARIIVARAQSSFDQLSYALGRKAESTGSSSTGQHIALDKIDSFEIDVEFEWDTSENAPVAVVSWDDLYVDKNGDRFDGITCGTKLLQRERSLEARLLFRKNDRKGRIDQVTGWKWFATATSDTGGSRGFEYAGGKSHKIKSNASRDNDEPPHRLEADTEYEFEVNIKCKDGEKSTSTRSGGERVTAVSLAGSPKLPDPPKPPEPPAVKPPGPPRGLYTIAGRGSITVSWLEVNPNDSPIDRYQVRWARASSAPASWMTGYLSRSSNYLSKRYRIGDLEDSTRYRVQVRARNDAGWSDWSDPIEKTTPPGPETGPPRPNPPTITSVTPGDGSLRLEWYAPVGSVPIVDYDINYRRAGSGLGWTEWRPEDVSLSRSATITGLTNGVRYEVYVWAHNDTAGSLPSRSWFATPRPGTGPSVREVGPTFYGPERDTWFVNDYNPVFRYTCKTVEPGTRLTWAAWSWDNVPSGLYEIQAYIPPQEATAIVEYTIGRDSQRDFVPPRSLNQAAHAGTWASVAEIRFPGGRLWMELADYPSFASGPRDWCRWGGDHSIGAGRARLVRK